MRINSITLDEKNRSRINEFEKGNGFERNGIEQTMQCGDMGEYHVTA
jgi:hypothetical protein